jgi:malonyl-CoA decarboxylase
VSFGDSLIKRVVEELKAEFPKLKTFATLSPMPGFRAWLRAQVVGGDLTPAELEAFAGNAHAIVALDDRSWIDDRATAERVKPAVLSAAARYLQSTRDGRAHDPVANFHLSNGASLERLNWLANPAPYGIDESLGVMVNYLYDRGRIASNAGAYLADGTIRASGHVRNLVKTTKL